MKKFLVLLLVLVIGMTAGIGGTVAYLIDTEEAVNVMTVGNVKIEQLEYQRAEGVDHTGTLTEGGLVPFVQGQKLYPAYPKNGLATDYTAEPTDLLSWGPYVTAEGAGNGLWNEEKLVGAMDKFVFVKNTGTSDAYYRTIIAFECPEDMEYSEGPDKEFMMNTNLNDRFDWEEAGYITVYNTRYLVMVATYNEKLAPKEISRPSLLQVVMTHNATNEDMELIGDSYEILVLSQAVQVENFETAKVALDTAFGKATKENATSWFSAILQEPFAVVTVLDKNDTLKNAEGTTILDENLKIDTTDSMIGMDLGKFSLDTAYQFEPLMEAEEGEASEYADWHADFVISATEDVPEYGIALAGYYDAWCSLNDDKWVALAVNSVIPAGEEIRLVQSMNNITVAYKEICEYGNDGIGFLCGAVALGGQEIDGKTVEALKPGTTLRVELRLYEATDGSIDSETGKYITTGVYTYTFE